MIFSTSGTTVSASPAQKDTVRVVWFAVLLSALSAIFQPLVRLLVLLPAVNHFCAICCCTRKEHGYGNIDCDMWRRRTNAKCRAYAESFRAAESEEEREAVFNASGLRWSELLRLPYFDPARFVVVDAMHNLFLGLIQEHFQGILGIRLAKDSDVDASPVLDIPLSDRTGNNLNDTERKSLSKALTWLMGPMNHELASELGMIKWTKKLSNLHLEALKFLCQELYCAPIAVDPRKKTMNRSES